ncbi:MAG: LysR family transcriptional regulator [Rhodobacteraceae bacterium]|nr:LysR family transcriptional regulator [Paracoccaceae bacterium]
MSRLTEMETFATVVEEGGFSDAARKMGCAKSTVSKHISNLEQRLGTRLLSRTTRRVSPTEIGLAYYDRATRILNDAGEADALVASLHSSPSGTLRVSVDADFGIHKLSPLLAAFMLEFPDINVTVVLDNNNSVDLINEGFDVAIRVGTLKDSTMRARKLTETNFRLVASPEYLAVHGRPKEIGELPYHLLLHHSNRAGANIWKLTDTDGEQRQVRAKDGLSVNDGQSLLNAAASGLGIAYLPSFLYREMMQEGKVVDVMPNLPQEPQSIYAVYPPGRFTQPKVRAFIDFLVNNLPD